MNEILFRGKSGGEWVTGIPYIAHYNKGTEGEVFAVCIITGVEHNPTTGFMSPENRCFVEVLPETVGQFTGLLDKNGKRIFEGDVLKINGGADDFFATVEFEHGCFVAAMHDRPEGSSKPELKYYLFDMNEIIGTIHDL